MSNREQIFDNILSMLQKDERNVAYFFATLKDPSLFRDLAAAGFFESDKIPKPEKVDNGFRLSNWPQSFYLQHLSEEILAGKITDSVFIETYLSVLSKIHSTYPDSFLARILFLCYSRVPPSFLKVEDVKQMFLLLDAFKQDTFIESAVHEGFRTLLSRLKNDEHSQQLLDAYVQELFKSYDPQKKFANDLELKYFSRHGMLSFKKDVFKLADLYTENPYVIEHTLIILNNLLEKILLDPDNDADKTSPYWRPAVEPHVQNDFHDSAPSLYVDFIFQLSSFLLKKNVVPELLSKWKLSSLTTFNRLYLALATDFPKMIPPKEAAEKLLQNGLDVHVRHEAFHFLNKHFSQLSVELQSKILDQIDAIKSAHTENAEEEKLFSAWIKLRWLMALKGNHDPRIQKMLAESKKITGEKEPEHPDFSTYMGTSWVGPNSPWTMDDFSKRSPDEILHQLKDFKDEDKFGKPSVEGLARQFQDFVAADPVKCSPLLKNLKSIPYVHVAAILDGYIKAWDAKNKFVPVDKILTAALDLVRSEEFRNALRESKNSHANWIVASTARFIDAGTRNDEHSFDPILNDEAYKILSQLMSYVRPEPGYMNSSDSYTRAINEPRGKIFEALILLTLRRARLTTKGSNEFSSAWDDFHKILQPVLDLADETEISIYAHLGAYYRQLLFLNEEWFYSEFGLIVPNPENKLPLWFSFMEGFCYVTAFVSKVFNLLDSKGYLLKFLRLVPDQKDQNSRLNRLQNRILELSLVAYFLGEQKLDSGLLAKIIETKDKDEWHHLVWVSESIIGEKPSADHVEKLRVFLNTLLDIRDNSRADNWKDHFKGIGRALKIFRDPTQPIVERIVEVIASDNESSWELNELVDFLDYNKNSYPEDVTRLFLHMLKTSKVVPEWPEEKVRGICQMLIDTNHKAEMIEVCRIYDARTMAGYPIKELCLAVLRG